MLARHHNCRTHIKTAPDVLCGVDPVLRCHARWGNRTTNGAKSISVVARSRARSSFGVRFTLAAVEHHPHKISESFSYPNRTLCAPFYTSRETSTCSFSCAFHRIVLSNDCDFRVLCVWMIIDLS